MEFKDALPYLSAIIAAMLSGVISFITAVRKSSNEIRQLKAQNEHEISKLMNQHKLDLKALEKKHELEQKLKDQEHRHRLEIIEKESQNSINASITQGLTGGLGNLFSGILDNPLVKEQLNEKIRESFESDEKSL